MANSGFFGKLKDLLSGGQSSSMSESVVERSDWNEEPIEVKSPELKSPEVKSPEVKSPEVRSPSSSTAVLDYVQCISTSGLHKMAYRTWGDPSNPKVLLCVHGLTRRGTDFDVLAQAMSKEYRVVAPDVVGRGDSDFLGNPMLYGVPQYVSDMVTLIARLNAQQLDWFGTSMGGLIGMMLGSMEGNPINKMILNDVGPKIDPAFLVRLMTYLGKPVTFATKEEGLKYANLVSATFGRHTPEQWEKYNSPQLIQKDGVWKLHYDPNINTPIMMSNPATAAAGEQALWRAFDRIEIPTLIVRGAESDLLSTSTVQEMCRRNPYASAVEVPNAGHAPAFILPEQIEIARKFFAQ
jgi:cobalt-zinc-cadmium efflux system protein